MDTALSHIHAESDLAGFSDCDLVVEAIIGLDTSNAIACSAKTGLGVPEILQAVVDRVPPPPARMEEPLRALIFFPSILMVAISLIICTGL